MIFNYEKFLESKSYGTLYHFTSSLYIIDILKSNKLISSKEIVDLYMDADNEESVKRFQKLEKKYPFFISTTRDQNFYKKDKSILTFLNTRVHLDKNKISANYKVIPVNWYNSSEYLNLKHLKNESEEAILLKYGEKDINLSTYSIKIDIPSLELFKEEIKYYTEEEFYNLDELIKKLKKIQGALTKNKFKIDKYTIKEEEIISKIYDLFVLYTELYCDKYNIELGILN